MPSRTPIAPITKAFVQSKGWKVFKEDDVTVGMLFGDENSEAMIDKYMLLIYGRDAQADLSIVVTGLTSVPDDKRKRVAEYFGRANFGLNHGCFKLDLSDGEIRFSASVDVETCNANDINQLLEFYCRIASGTWNKYLPGLKLSLNSDEEISTIIKKIEAM